MKQQDNLIKLSILLKIPKVIYKHNLILFKLKVCYTACFAALQHLFNQKMLIIKNKFKKIQLNTKTPQISENQRYNK